MSTTIEVKYFNSFWVKKTVNTTVSANGGDISKIPNWPGLPYEKYDATSESTRYLNYASVGTLSPPTDNRPDVGYVIQTYNWLIEEARVKGSFNANTAGYGVKAYLVDEDYTSEIKRSKIIYSGLFNSKTNVNETNVFSSAQSITFQAPVQYGSIQKLYSEDTKLIIFQENKISRSMVNKNILYTAEGRGAPVTSQNLVIGEITPFVGEYGISTDPLSFAQFGRRKYFTDKNRNVAIRLSDNGITEISSYGMADFFRDKLSDINSNALANSVFDTIDGQNPVRPASGYSENQPIAVGEPNIYKNPGGGDPNQFVNVKIGSAIFINGLDTGCYVKSIDQANAKIITTALIPFTITAGSSIEFRTYVKDAIVGGYDVYNDNYIVSIQKSDDTYNTLAFDEKVLGWVSFYDYKPMYLKSLFNRMYSTSRTNLWLHNSENVLRNSFYGDAPINSSIIFIFNAQPNIVKTFKTVNYEGSNGWEATSVVSDDTGEIFTNGSGWTNMQDNINKILSYTDGAYVEDGVTYYAGFNLKENRYVANVVNKTPAQPGEIIIGSEASGIKGYFTTVTFTTDTTTNLGGMKELFAVSTEYVMSSY